MPESLNIESQTARCKQLCDDIQQTLGYLSEMGCSGFDCSRDSIELIDSWTVRERIAPESLAAIRHELGDCSRCGLCKGRKNIVFGAGNEAARLMFVGEGPGHDEDRQGLPFVGAAGQLLTKIIEAMNLKREQVYICNVIKCRPPGNRNPLPDEIHACFAFLRRQIQAVQPEFICALGTFAAQTLLESSAPISSLRGRIRNYAGIKLLATYHPAYLLRNPDQKREVWEDMKMLMREMG